MRHPLSPTSRCGRPIAALLVGVLAAALAACSDTRPAHRDGITVVDGRRDAAIPAPVRTVAPAPVPSPVASPTPAPRRQRFTSPPLPAELVDDGALKPLPARPPAEAFGRGEQH